MNTIKTIIIGCLLFFSNLSNAQVNVNVNVNTPSLKINIGTPPNWGPVGYDEVEYYYLPDIEMYYDIRAAHYIYYGKGKWNRTPKLPYHCRNYNLYEGYKVVLTDYHGRTPYTHFHSHKKKYCKGYKGKPQKNRGNNNDQHGHHSHNKKHKQNKHDDDDYDDDNHNDKHDH